jgi:ribosomal protein S1
VEDEDEEDTATTVAQLNSKSLSAKPKLVSKRLRVGDAVDIYILSVSKQSGQFTVTTNPSVQGRKAKDLKKENDAEKKLKRLRKSVGGSLQKIWDMEGKECEGTVKATSQSGDWLYVQPHLNGLPVGVATLNEGLGDFAAGDSVRIRIAGVDEERGQLALQVIGKLAP